MIIGYQSIPEPFQTVSLLGHRNRNRSKRFGDQGLVVDHRAKATVLMRALRVMLAAILREASRSDTHSVRSGLMMRSLRATICSFLKFHEGRDHTDRSHYLIRSSGNQAGMAWRKSTCSRAVLPA